jgi:hypothetical protein
MSHEDQQKKWEEFSGEMRRGNPPLFDPTKINIPLSASARIRFEPNARDAMNSRIWESLKYDVKEPTSEEIKASPTAIFMDMNPLSSRNSIQNYGQQQQNQFFPDIKHHELKKSGVDQSIKVPTFNQGLANNPYLQRLDPVNDARNIPREMRSAVYEDNRERDIDSTRILSERQFTHRYIPEPESQKLAVLQAYELLRPKTDDYTKQFQH